MRGEHPCSKRQQQTQHGNPQHGRLDGVAGQAQIQAPIKKNETDEQSNGCFKALAQIKGLHQAKPRSTDQQP